MSLINKVLRDLDARHAPAVDRAALPSSVHVISPPRPRRRWMPLTLVLVTVAAGGWYFLEGPGSPAPPPVRLVLPPSQPLPPPLPAAAVATAPAAAPASTALQADLQEAVQAEAGAPKQAQEPVPAIVLVPSDVQPKAAASAPARPKPEPASGAGTARTGKPAPEAKGQAGTAPPLPAANAADAPSVKDLQPPPGPSSIDKNPRHSPVADAAENEYRKAMAALRRGAASEAVENLHAALYANKSHVSARQALLSLLVERQQWVEVQALAEEGLALDPAQTGWAIILARLQLENGKLAEAATTLALHAAYAEQNGEYQAFHALVLQKMRRPADAAARYRAALAIKPGESRWWYGLGLSLEADQKPQEARDAFLRAREGGNLPPELAGAVEQRLR